MGDMQVRLFQREDADQIAQLFHETVRHINLGDYSSEQVKAWAPDDLDFRDWAKVCANRYTYVVDDTGTIAGFGELEPDGHIDCFYCHKDYQRRGVGRRIYAAIEAKARDLKLERLFVEASITAKPFFERLGFTTVKEQQVPRGGQWFTNFVMEKWLMQADRRS
jgi:putative acetyltransferase